MDDLDRLAPYKIKGSAKGLVASNQGVEGLLEVALVQGALQPKGLRDVVEGAVWFELVEEPEALLGKGEGEGGLLPALARDRRGRRGAQPFSGGVAETEARAALESGPRDVW
jgi:hypothetical protein